MREGKDPSAERKASKRSTRLAAANAFEAVARDLIAKQANTAALRTAKERLRIFEYDVFPAIGARPIAAIEAPELLDMASKIEARGAHYLSRRALQLCGLVFRYGIAAGLCARNPAADLRGALTPHKARHMPAVKPTELAELVARIKGYDGEPRTRLALQLLALTFVRTVELIGAEWTEVAFENAEWTIPAARMKKRKAHVVPLSRQAFDLLAQLNEFSGEGRYVFPGRNSAIPISNNTLLYALYRMGYHSRMTGHGFRAVASTAMNDAREAGLHTFGPDVIERQLAHDDPNPTRAAYNRAEHLPERRALMQWWADHIDALCAGKGRT